MPPKYNNRNKTNYKARNRRVAGFDEIKARNEELAAQGREDRTKKEGSSDGESEDDTEETKKEVFVKEKGSGAPSGMFDMGSLNRALEEGEEGQGEQLSRKQREELEKERKKRAYEAAHARGETDEAKSDLARLQKIRQEREAAKKKREDEQKEKEATEKSKSSGQKEYIAALGGEAARTGARGKAIKKKVGHAADQMDDFKDLKKAEEIDVTNVQVGSIDACRLAEDDFM